MLNKETLNLIVASAMDKFAKENNGEKGWTKKDIENEIIFMSGTKEDLYSAMKIGMEICFSNNEIRKVIYN